MAKWQIKGKYVEACNCAVGCPCNTTGFPTKGKCEANIAFHVEQGNRDGVNLAGAKVAVAVMWPGAIHEGNGKMAVFVDAKPEQRDALISILTAKDGGMPWEILATTIKDIKGPFFETVEFDAKGTATKVKVGNKLDMQLKGLTNPVTGEPNEAHMVIPTGFIWKDGNISQSAANKADADGVRFDHAGNSAFYAEIDWSNAAPAGKTAGTRF
jgi:hypothetical protein